MPIAFVSGGLLSRTLPPNRRNKTLCAPTNFHLPAVLRTQRTLGGSGTPQEIPGHLPRVRSAFAGAAGSSALRWPPLRSWPLVGFEGPERSWRQELQVGHARKFSTHYFDFRHHRHFDRSTALASRVGINQARAKLKQGGRATSSCCCIPTNFHLFELQ